MANIFVTFYEWLNGYFVNFSGYLVTVIITVAFVFWGVEIFRWLEYLYRRLMHQSYRSRARMIHDRAPHLASFIIFLIGALIVIPALQGLVRYFLQPILRTTSLLVILVVIFMIFYMYYVHVYRPKILGR